VNATMKQVAAIALLGVAALIHSTDSAAAEPVAQCQILKAGQTINAGSVCVTNDKTTLQVTYTTTGNWYLADLHLFVGQSLTEMPQTKTGNPKIGNFPYTIENVNSQSYTFTLPLGALGIFDPCAKDNPALYIAAHAVLVLRDSAGNVIDKQTGWAAGTQMNAKGSWAMYFQYLTQCDDGPVNYACDTAFAVGDQTFFDLGIVPDVKGGRWGWQLTIDAGTSSIAPIYAGAGQNDLTKGTHAGDLSYSYSGGVLTLTYTMYSPWVLQKTHVYAGSTSTTTIAPGQYGNQHDPLQNVWTDTYQLSVSGNPIYVVAHAEACRPSSN